MEKIFSDQNLMLVVNVQNLLAAEGILGELRNTYASGASGSLAFTEVWPELWIEKRDVARASAILAELSQQPEQAWTCSSCVEENPSSFDFCWQCGEPSS